MKGSKIDTVKIVNGEGAGKGIITLKAKVKKTVGNML